MTMIDRVDPELVAALKYFPNVDLQSETLPASRSFMTEMSAKMRAQLPEIEGVETVSYTHLTLPTN